MQRGYFKTAWSDITQSPHWVTRILLLALLCFIPVFGWIVIAGYLWDGRAIWRGACTLRCLKESSRTPMGRCIREAFLRQ